MNCQLCGSDRPQLASAQIVPDFMLKYIQDEESGRAVMRVYDDASDQLLQVEEGGIEPDGELVCEACLATIGEWDRYADRLMYQDSGLVIENMSVGDEESGTAEEAKVIRNVDYGRFKLFQLSLLWRMGASDVIPFEPIDIGIHRQRLAEMLRSREPGAPEDFPCVMATIAPGGVHFVDFFDVRFWAERDAEARALAGLGATTVLISGPTAEADPDGVEMVAVETARQMLDAVMGVLPADLAVCAAAVSDWRPAKPSDRKIKKNGKTPT
ncbi:MAG: hypothetical protein IIA41_10450, partial [SAR324 cluster bacterium]|nr:hypothetical protein [SAR324 cluster bacterium]